MRYHHGRCVVFPMQMGQFASMLVEPVRSVYQKITLHEYQFKFNKSTMNSMSYLIFRSMAAYITTQDGQWKEQVNSGYGWPRSICIITGVSRQTIFKENSNWTHSTCCSSIKTDESVTQWQAPYSKVALLPPPRLKENVKLSTHKSSEPSA